MSSFSIHPECQKRRECLCSVMEELEQISNRDEEFVSVSSLCKLHDRLISSLAEYDMTKPDAEILRLRLTKEEGFFIRAKERVPVEADLFRAVKATSLLLLDKLPSNTAESIKTQLQTTIIRSNAILKVLSEIYEQVSDRLSEGIEDNLPTKYPLLGRLISEKKSSFECEENATISLDRSQLQMEEEMLVQMASTPIPSEFDQHQSINPTSSLVARMSIGQDKVQIELDEQGILRTRFASKHESVWWALTPESSVSYQSPVFTITSVTTNQPHFSIVTLSLEVGRDGHLWWEKASKIVQKLKASRDVYDDIKKVFPLEEYCILLEKARHEVCLETTLLN